MADRLLIAPQDLRTADPTRASEIYAGRFAFAGKIVICDGRSPAGGPYEMKWIMLHNQAEAPAKTYIRISSLIDSVNRKLFFGKDVTGEIRDDVADKDLRTLLRQPGVTYVRDDVQLDESGR